MLICCIQLNTAQKAPHNEAPSLQYKLVCVCIFDLSFSYSLFDNCPLSVSETHDFVEMTVLGE